MPRSAKRVTLDDVSDSLAWTHSTLCQYIWVCAAFTPRHAGAVVHCTSLNWAIVDYGNTVEADDNGR